MTSTNAYVGATLSVTPGTYLTPATVSDEWYRCDSSPPCIDTGTAGTSYTVTYADVGYTLEVIETATATFPNTGMTMQTSNQTPEVTRPEINSTPPPVVGNTLTVSQATFPNSDADSVTDQWYDCNASGENCNAITGATGTSYTLTPSDDGHTVEDMETATYSGTATARVASPPTAVVIYPPPAADSTNPPTISGTLTQGQTLTASPGGFSNSPTSYSYQWQDCNTSGQSCAPIPGATNSTYTLAAGDVANTIVVSVTAANDSLTAATASSPPTKVVQTPSTVSLTAAPSAPVANQGVTLAATVTAQAATGTPSGSVAFFDKGKAIGGCASQAVNPTGQSVTVLCQTSFGAESGQLTATFTPAAGSVVLGSSTSSASGLTVGQDATTTRLDASAQVAIHALTTYTATVIPANSGSLSPSGSVEFLDGGKPISGCAARPVVGSGATCTVSYTATGSNLITAQYLGDANFSGSSSTAQPVQVTTLATKGNVTATMQWTFQYAPTYTRVINMVINGVPAGATVQVRCHGHGCPYAKHTQTMAKAKPCTKKKKSSCPVAGRINLTSTFRRKLSAGAQITIEIRRPQYVGKYYSFSFRARKQPKVRIACLAVNGTKPDVGC